MLKNLETLSYMILGIGFSFLLLLIFSCGPILSVWMFLNSMQLILHIPLLNGSLPGNSHWFMLSYLNVIRLHVGGWHTSLQEYLGYDGLTEIEEAKLA